MPILDLQRRVMEVGRIRMGTSTPRGKGKIPKRLETWRLTSQDRTRLDAAAVLYGGKVVPWADTPGFFDLITETSELPVVVIPGQAISQWWETWGQKKEGSGNECLVRCDGRERTDGKPCSCPADYDDRKEASNRGKACKPHTRLNVILREVPGVGYWRLESVGFYAAVELAGSTALLEEATRRGALLPARLRLEYRSVVREGTTQKYPVPVLDVDVTFLELTGADRPHELVGAPAGVPALAAGAGTPELEPGFVPAPERDQGIGIREGLDAVNRQTETQRHARSAAPLGAPAQKTAPKPLAVPADDMNAESAPARSQSSVSGAPSDRATATSTAPDPTAEAVTADPVDEPESVLAELDDVVDGEAELLEDDPDPFPGEQYATVAQAKLVHVRADKAGISEERLDELILETTGGKTDSAKLIPKRLVEVILTAIAAEPTS